MADDPLENVDDWLREAFEPDPPAALRVAREALAVHARTRRRRLAAACAAATVCLAAALVFWPSRTVPPVGPTGVGLVGSVADGLLVVPLPDGSVAITGGEPRLDRPRDGYGIVLVEGGR